MSPGLTCCFGSRSASTNMLLDLGGRDNRHPHLFSVANQPFPWAVVRLTWTGP